MEDWKIYPNNRKFVHRESYILIVPNDYDKPKNMPLFCDVCEIRFANKEDEKTYKSFGCCSSCADTWAYSHKEMWKEGWRPSKQQIEESVRKRCFVNPKIAFE